MLTELWANFSPRRLDRRDVCNVHACFSGVLNAESAERTTKPHGVLMMLIGKCNDSVSCSMQHVEPTFDSGHILCGCGAWVLWNIKRPGGKGCDDEIVDEHVYFLNFFNF